jgi:hypothetical protein
MYELPSSPCHRGHAILGGIRSFIAARVAQLGLLSALWLIGLVAVCEIVQLLNPFSRGRTVS